MTHCAPDITLSPEQEAFLLAPQDVVLHTPKSLAIDALYALNEAKTATRLDNCAKYFKHFRCGHGEVWTYNSSKCGLRIVCLECFQHVAIENYRKYEGIIELLADHAEFTTFRLPIPPDADPKKFYNQTTQRLHKLLPKQITASNIDYLPTPAIKIIYCGSAPITSLRKVQTKFPRMSYSRHRKDAFLTELSSLVKMSLPSDPGTRAELEVYWKRTKLFRVWGISKEEKLSVYKYFHAKYTVNSTSTDYDNVPIGSGHPHTTLEGEVCTCPAVRRVPKCPKCGGSAVEETKWFVRGQRKRLTPEDWKPINRDEIDDPPDDPPMLM